MHTPGAGNGACHVWKEAEKPGTATLRNVAERLPDLLLQETEKEDQDVEGVDPVVLRMERYALSKSTLSKPEYANNYN